MSGYFGRTSVIRVSLLVFACPVLLHARPGLAQQTCPSGIGIEGTVTDPSDAAIVGAHIRTSGGEEVISDATGAFRFACIAGSSQPLQIEANGFMPMTLTATAQIGSVARVSARMAIAAVTSDVQVNANAADALDTSSGAGTATLSEDDIRQLPDDPDDLLQQLQLLASTGGGRLPPPISLWMGSRTAAHYLQRAPSHRSASTPIRSRPSMNVRTPKEEESRSPRSQVHRRFTALSS